MKKPDPGKMAEKAAEDWLKVKSAASISFAYHRLPDARSARGALASQPADFQACNKGAFAYLEVKETKQTLRLPKAKVSQWGTLNAWHLAGCASYVLVYRSALADWVTLGPAELFNYDDVPASFPMAALKSYPTAAAALQEIFP